MFFQFTYDSRFSKTKMNDREKFSRRFQLEPGFLLGVPCHEQPPAFSAFRCRSDDANYTLLPQTDVVDICNSTGILKPWSETVDQKKYIYIKTKTYKKHKIKYHLNWFCHMAWPINVERYLPLVSHGNGVYRSWTVTKLALLDWARNCLIIAFDY